MLPLDVYERERVWLEERVAIDVWDDADLSVGAFLEHAAEGSSILRSPVDGESGSIKALQLRHVVLGADEALDGSGMSISEGMTVVGGEEVVGDSLVVEALGGEPVPHPLTVARLKVMRPSITPNIDAVEVIVELLVVKEEEPYGEDEVVVILIGFLAIAEEIDIRSHALSVAEILQHDDAILHDGAVSLVSDFRREVG
jgi:hypothetical protein